jgi:hypothetical protein
MSTPEILTARELATHAADIKHMQEDMDKMLESMKIMQATLTAISATLSEAQGGWKVLMMVSGVAGTVVAGIVQLVHWWNK